MIREAIALAAPAPARVPKSQRAAACRTSAALTFINGTAI